MTQTNKPQCTHQNIETIWILGKTGRRRPDHIVCRDCGKIILKAAEI